MIACETKKPPGNVVSSTVLQLRNLFGHPDGAGAVAAGGGKSGSEGRAARREQDTHGLCAGGTCGP